ncbi:MAG: glycosyltransferase family 87 protein [Pseudomonadota bacterium]
MSKIAIGFALIVLGTKYYFMLRPIILSEAPLRSSDFYVFWAAGQIMRDQGAVAIFDSQIFNNELKTLFEPTHHLGTDQEGFGLFWLYPPTILPWVLPFGYISATWSIFLFTTVSLIIWYITLRSTFMHDTKAGILPVLFAPIVFVCLAFEQNGILTACILIGFIYSVHNQRNPWLIALFAMLMLFKPTYGLLMPLVLIFERRWDAFFASAVLCSAFTGAVTMVWGVEYWHAFAEQQADFLVLIKQGLYAQFAVTTMSFFLQIGSGFDFAINAHIFGVIVQLVCFIIIWRMGNWDLRIAAFLILTPLLYYYGNIYDFVTSAVAIGILYPYFARFKYGKVFLVLYWLIPMAFRTSIEAWGMLELPILNPIVIGIITYLAIKKIEPVKAVYSASNSASQ